MLKILAFCESFPHVYFYITILYYHNLGFHVCNKPVKSNSSSIGDHISKSGHKASFDGFEIIGKTDNHFDLLIHESLFKK